MVIDTRTRIVKTAARLLQHRGYHGTSLNDILRESGAPRGSLYFHFPGGKDQLALEATRVSVDEATVALKESLAAGDDPASGVRIFVEGAAALMRESEYTFGCPVAPVILDAAAGNEDLARLCRDAFEEWVGLLEAAFVDAGMPADRAASLALLVESSIEGLLLIGRAYLDPEPIMVIAAELESVVRAALPARSKRTARRRSAVGQS